MWTHGERKKPFKQLLSLHGVANLQSKAGFTEARRFLPNDPQNNTIGVKAFIKYIEARIGLITNGVGNRGA